MKIVLTGGTGFIGRRLIEELLNVDHDVVLLTRRRRLDFPSAVHQEEWDAKTVGVWCRVMNGAGAIINLTGESLAAQRWTQEQKKRIISSRLNATRVVIEALRRESRKPSVLINASAIGYYGDIPDGTVKEDHPHGSGFLAETCTLWEAEALKAEDIGIRVALMRIGVILGKDGGIIKKMLLPFRLFVGGRIGSGRQWLSWIHLDDAVRAILHVLNTPALDGPINITAPEPVTMNQFCLALGNVLKRPSWIPVPDFVVRLAVGEMSEMVLTGQRVVPQKLLEQGFNFRHSNLLEALESILC
jgi:uncharacterized protein (TIGR01777 family)